MLQGIYLFLHFFARKIIMMHFDIMADTGYGGRTASLLFGLNGMMIS